MHAIVFFKIEELVQEELAKCKPKCGIRRDQTVSQNVEHTNTKKGKSNEKRVGRRKEEHTQKLL